MAIFICEHHANTIHNIIMKTLTVVPKAWDMHHENFNCDCHLELKDTYLMIGDRFNVTPEVSKEIIELYFKQTNGYV